MEQKKTLWIIAAVGAFLLVVLGAAGILYSPAKNTSSTVASVTPVTKHSTEPENTNNNGWINKETTSPAPVAVPTNSTSTTKVNEMVVVSDNTTIYDLQKPAATETTIDLNALKTELAAANNTATNVQVPVQPQNINITVTLPEAEKQAAPAPVIPAPVVHNTTIEKTTYVPVPVQNVQQKKSNDSTTSSQKNTSSSSVKPSPKKEVKKEPVETKEVKKITQYWVQVASYSNKKGAENAREILDGNKISSDIFTFEDNKDRLYFRVRVGPYTTKSEAEYWQARIKKIPYFEKNDSYVTSTVK